MNGLRAGLRSTADHLEGTSRSVIATTLQLLGERRASSAACSTSYGLDDQKRRASTASHEQPRLAGSETYAEFTQLQKLLQQYQRSLGAVGKAATVFTEQVWFRKNASGRQYLPHQLLADLGKDELAATEEELIFIIRDSTVRQLSTVIAHLGSLEQRPDLKLLDTVCESLKRHVDAFTAGQEGDPGQLVDVLSGLAGMGHSPVAPVLGSISHVLRLKLEECSAAHISSLTNSMAAFGWTHFPLMDKVAEAVQRRREEFTSEALADILYSFAILQYDARHMVDTILERILFDLKCMSPAALSQLVSGLHLLNHRDSVTDVFLDALAEAALLQLQHFSAKQLATLAYNYGTLNHWGRNDQELLDAITIRMLHQHHDLTAGQLANLVWALARASYVSPRTNALLAVVSNHAAEVCATSIWQTFTTAFSTVHCKSMELTGLHGMLRKEVLPQFRPEELARLMHSLSTLSFYSAPLFIRAEGTIMDSLDEYSAEDLALIATAFARVMHEAPRLLPAVMARMEGHYSDLGAAGLCGLVWAAAVLRELTPATFQTACTMLDDRGLQEFTARDFMRLYQAEMLMEIQARGRAEPPPRLTEWLRGYAVKSLNDKLYLDRFAGNAQQEICRCLMRLGISYTLENVVDGVLAVDIVLKIKEHPKMAIKVEQVSKYTSSRPQLPLADAMITRRLLEARGWNVICVSEHELVRLKNLKEKLALLTEKLSAAKDRPPPAVLL